MKRLFVSALVFTFTFGPSARPDKANSPPGVERGVGEKVVRVVGLDDANRKALATVKWDAARWNALLAVYLDRRQATGNQPAILGRHFIKGGILAFEPRYPFARGSRYRVVFDPAQLPFPVKKPRQTLRFADARARKKATFVRQIYPTADKLPENQLKFYLHFSAPMTRGNVYKHIKLLGPSGKAVPWPFLELDEELWNPDGTRFTLFFDPGRIKRGLKPRQEAGPALIEGKKYTLVIDGRWRDADDVPLKASYRKTFTVGPPDNTCPDPKKWQLRVPTAGASGPLTVRFAEPLDHALLHRMLRVTDARGRTLPGVITVTDKETRWHFTPKSAWQAGDYFLVADTRLEDLAGNSIGQPFEVDVLRRVERRVRKKTKSIAFKVKARQP